MNGNQHKSLLLLSVIAGLMIGAQSVSAQETARNTDGGFVCTEGQGGQEGQQGFNGTSQLERRNETAG